jgi:uncharacterized protein YndB with AHSA1/START domain
MSVRKDNSGRRWVQAEVEVPGTPEEVWAAIATAEGVSSWFVPTEKREDGTIISHFGPGIDAVAKETVWDPPRRFAAEGELGPNAPKLATEWIVEAKAGGVCVVRVVHSLFASSDDWDDQLEGTERGWADFFEILRLYLGHFRGQPCSAFQLLGLTGEPASSAWETLARSLGLVDARKGEYRKSPNGAPRLAGNVEQGAANGHAFHVLLRLDEPGTGLAHMFALAMGDTVFISVRVYVYGAGAATVVAENEPVWRSWMNEHFPLQGEPHQTG